MYLHSRSSPARSWPSSATLAWSEKPSRCAADAYKQAALLIEFLRESKWGKDKFQTFIHTVGLVPRGKLPAIEAAFRKVYECDLATVEAKRVEYCKKR